jgi:hypothetical protein
VNETAANVAKMLTMMTRMPDAQVDYLFDKKLIYTLHAASQDIVAKAEGMVDKMDGWYPGCPEQVEDRLRRGNE